MKKIYLSFLSLSFGLAINAQTLTQANNAPYPGDMYGILTCTGNVNQGNAGANQTYNFSSISVSSTATTYTASNSTNTTYTPANVVVTANTGEASYFLSSSSDLKYYGGNILIGTIPATINYTSPAIYEKYPMSLGTSTNSVIGGTLSAFSNNGTFTGSASVIADGTGTLMLPGRTFTNVIRVVTSQTINFAVPAFGVTNGTLNQVNYDYYIPLRKSPLFTISTSTAAAPPVAAASSQTVLTVANDYMVVGIKENKNILTDLLVFPNPAGTTVNFATQSAEAKYLVVTDISGRQVEKQSLYEGKLKLDVSAYNNGIYLYSIIGSNNEKLKTGKLTVSH